MRLFVYEHLCASGSPSPLRTEGWAMLSALVEDFQALPDCEVLTLLDHECPKIGTTHCRRIDPQRAEEAFCSLTAQADATVVIAPETGGVLARLTQLIKGRSLGCTCEAIERTADKKALAEHWHRHGVPTPELVGPSDFPGFAVVLKPRDGAGSQATFLIRDRDQWAQAWQQAHGEMASDFLVQRFVSGQSASVAFLIGHGGVLPLASAAQHLSEDGRFHYLGGQVPLEPTLAKRAVALASRAIACVPGLAGYVGVDLVLGNDAREDVAIEINPRLTTSYLGLRRLARRRISPRHGWTSFRDDGLDRSPGDRELVFGERGRKPPDGTIGGRVRASHIRGLTSPARQSPVPERLPFAARCSTITIGEYDTIFLNGGVTMIEQLSSESPKILGFKLSGKLHDEDYKIFVPLVDNAIAKEGKVRVLAQFHDFHGWDAHALWDDIKFATTHCAKIERIALVGETKWEKWMATVCKPFTMAKIRYFDAAQVNAARAWLAEA